MYVKINEFAYNNMFVAEKTVKNDQMTCLCMNFYENRNRKIIK